MSPIPPTSSSNTPPTSSHDPHSHRQPEQTRSNSSIPRHPLLPPLGPQADTLLAFEVNPAADILASQRQNRVPVVPEKCLTFCSQRADGPAMCRMFCLRRRHLASTQKEELERLRPKIVHRIPSSSIPITTPLLNLETNKREEMGEMKSTDWWNTLRNPFEALRRKVEPYSFIYLRGTFEGVVGRYMEEMEHDDGEHDFGTISRGMRPKRGEEVKMEILDWGEHGTLVHLPLTSLLHPIISFPQNVARVFRPATSVLNMYTTSFSDGSQSRTFHSFVEAVQRGAASDALHRMEEYQRNRLERRTQLIEERAKEKEKAAADAVRHENEVERKGSGSGQELARRLKEARVDTERGKNKD